MGTTVAKSDADKIYRDLASVWLKEVMVEADITTQDALADKLGTSRSTANRYLSGAVRPELPALIALASSTGRPVPQNILDAFYSSAPNAHARTKVKLLGANPLQEAPKAEALVREIPVIRDRHAQVIGRVGAGAVIEAISGQNFGSVGVPANILDGSAYRVEGDSCYPVFEHGDVIVIEGEQRANPAEFLHRYCVVEVRGDAHGDERVGYLKKVLPGVSVTGHGQLYNLVSENLDEEAAAELQNRVVISARPVVLRIMRGA